MKEAIELAQEAFSREEVPVGAVIVNWRTGQIIAKAHNLVRANCDPTAHAEILALRQAAKIMKASYLYDCDLYVTLEPCPMCAYAISLAKIRRLYYGAMDEKRGGVDSGPLIYESSSTHHIPEVYQGIMERESKELLQRFFKLLRSKS